MSIAECLRLARDHFVVVVPLDTPPQFRQFLITKLYEVVAASILRQEG